MVFDFAAFWCVALPSSILFCQIKDKKNCEIAYQKLLFQYNLSEACGSLPLILPFLRSSAMVGAETAGCIGRERAQLREEEERVIKMGWSTSGMCPSNPNT